eukprot:Em0006g141a
MWHDVKSLVANEMAKVNEKMEGICQKLSTLEIKVQALEADKGTCTSEAPAEPAKRKRRTPLCLQVHNSEPKNRNLTSQSGVQQGDPLGPLLFSLVLNVVVKAIATHPECSDLLYHVWYLDDGVLAGPSSHVRKALSLLIELGPPLGLHVNIKKWLSWIGKGLRQVFYLRDWTMLVKSTPKWLWYSSGFVVVTLFDQDVQKCFTSCTGVHSSIAAWKQAQLSLSRGGLGLRSLSHHAPAAFIASLCFSGLGSNSHVHLLQSLETFNSSVHQSDNIQIGSVLEKLPSQKTLSNVLISNWALGKTAACDISVTSPLNSNIMSEAGVTAGAVAQATELRKHEANNVKCSEAMAAYGLVDGLLTSVQTFAMASATGQG